MKGHTHSCGLVEAVRENLNNVQRHWNDVNPLENLYFCEDCDSTEDELVHV
jgi:hypothetical protein